MAGTTGLAGRGAVVTGAGHGIGRALATRLAAEGARVVVNDLDADAARAVADEIGGTAAPGDCACEDGVRALVDTATGTLGRIDLFFANAGIDGGPLGGQVDSLQTPDGVWSRVLETNVMALVRAARALVPAWLESGGGRFVVTASAAGLLTMIGSAPYSVTKHASVAFAEWLSITYGHRGVTVQAICPQGVQTRMLEESGPLQALLSRDQALAPEAVADAWVASLADDRFLVLPHPEVGGYYAARAQDTDRWLAGMRRLQARLDESRGIA
jgi:NAD(P)-dependent dehydrogenase (short-subunit alcohol dehydrogenase family)